ncbi:MAG: TIM barrel protein [Actinomycetota bacterium]|nr:TIM barrel protein [Actinomycetota bacterium]
MTSPELAELVRRALAEDVGSGDVTTRAVVPEDARARAMVTQKQPGAIFGLEAAEEVFRALDERLHVTRLAPEGVWREGGEVLRVEGAAAPILAGAGAGIFNAAVVADAAWSPPLPLDDDAWRRVARHLAEIRRLVEQHGLTLALHPHAGTQVQTAEDVEHLLATSDVGWCLDTGHLVVGGVDPAEFVRRHGDRIVHAHLKDVDADVARRVHAGELSLVQGTQQGLFRPLGRGDARIDDVMDELRTCGYERWLVLEQDTALTGEEPPVGSGPVTDVRTSIEYLLTLAPTRRERVAES